MTRVPGKVAITLLTTPPKTLEKARIGLCTGRIRRSASGKRNRRERGDQRGIERHESDWVESRASPRHCELKEGKNHVKSVSALHAHGHGYRHASNAEGHEEERYESC